MSLSRAVLEKFAELEGCARIVYGTATGDNIVPIGDSTSTAVTPALTPVVSGDYCAVMEAINGDRLILGPVDSVNTGPVARCRATTSSFAVPNESGQFVPLDAESFDSGGMHSNSTNNTRITVPTGLGGLWSMGWAIRWPAYTNNRALGLIYVNGAADNIARTQDGNTGTAGSTRATHMNGSDIYELDAGDYIELRTYQDTGVTRTIAAVLWMYRVSA